MPGLYRDLQPAPNGYLVQKWPANMAIKSGSTTHFKVYWANNYTTSEDRAFDFRKVKISFHTLKGERGFAGSQSSGDSTSFGAITVNGHGVREGQKAALLRDGTASCALHAKGDDVWGWILWRGWIDGVPNPIYESETLNVHVVGKSGR